MQQKLKFGCGRFSVVGPIKGKPGTLGYKCLFCGSYRCKNCRPSKLKKVRARIAQIAAERKLQRMATLTLDPSRIPRRVQSDRYLRECWRKMRVLLARWYGKSLPFVAVLEFQESGIAHLHVLLGVYIPQKWLSAAWQSIGGGRIVDIRYVDVHRVTAYLACYLTGQKVEHTLFFLPNRARIFTTSRSIVLWGKKKATGWWLRKKSVSELRDAVGIGYNERYEATEDLKRFGLESLTYFEGPIAQVSIGNRDPIAVLKADPDLEGGELIVMPSIDFVQTEEQKSSAVPESSNAEADQVSVGISNGDSESRPQPVMVASTPVTPFSVSTGGTVPRRRFQRGCLIKRGKKPVWVGIFREDRVLTDGTIKRIQRKVVLGPCGKVSERAAYAAFQPYLDAVNVAPAPAPKVGKTLLSAVQEWREQIAVNLKPSTVRAAESHLRQHILPRLGSLRLQELTAKTLQAFVTTLAATGITRKSIENILQSLFSILRIARLFGNALPQVKRSDLVLPRLEAGREVRSLDATQIGQIIGNAKEPFTTMFAVLGVAGLRGGELLGLKVVDLDFNRKVIHIQRSVDSRTKKELSTKGGRVSQLPMPQALEKKLTDFLANYHRENPNGYLFANRNGNPYSIGKVVEYGLWPVQDALGIPRTGLHAFRHAAASELFEENAPLPVVQRQLRHRDARTTLQMYGHVVGDSQRKAVESLSAKIARHSAVELLPSAELLPSSG